MLWSRAETWRNAFQTQEQEEERQGPSERAVAVRAAGLRRSL